MVFYLGWKQLPDQSRALFKVPVLGRFLGIFLTFHAVCFAWIFFRANTSQDAVYIASHLFPFNNANLIPKLGLTGGEMLVALVGILILESVQYVDRKYGGQAVLDKMRLSVRWAGYYILILIISLLGEFGGQRFLYFQF